MNLIYKILTILLILLGVVHTAFTPVFYDSFIPAALWFAGAGLLLIFGGLINLVYQKTPQLYLKNITIYANSILAIYTCLIMIIVPVFQAYVAFGIVLIVLFCSIFIKTNKK